MSIFNTSNNAKPYTVSQPQLNSSDRTAQLKAKTKYAAAVNLAKNGGVLVKRDGSKYIGTVHTNSVALTSTASYADLLDVTKGKYLLTPPPSSNLDASFAPENGEVYYGSFAITNYDRAHIPVTMLGFPTITNVAISAGDSEYEYPNQLVVNPTTNPAPSATTVNDFNNTNLVVDPEYRLFYGTTTCGQRNYFKNVLIDPSVDVKWTNENETIIISSRPYNQQQAQRIIANQAQSLRGFQFPTRVHFDLDNCGSKASITPVAPDAPVIFISSQTGNTVTISWLYGFDGGSPITSQGSPPGNPVWGYTIYVNGTLTTSIAPKPCLNSFTLTVSPGDQICVTASNCVPNTQYLNFGGADCTTLTSEYSNCVTPAPTPNSLTITPIEDTGAITTNIIYLNSSGNVLDPLIPDLNGFTVYKFNYTSSSSSTNAGSVNVVPNNAFNVTYLIVGGGGGGGFGPPVDNDGYVGGGGGGAGGLLSGGPLGISSGPPYVLTVGGGGPTNTNGADSAFDLIVATGGGGGGNGSIDPPGPADPGKHGGSGGGGGYYYTLGTIDPGPGGSGISLQGNSGGTSQHDPAGGFGAGGGGAGVGGQDADAYTAGDGGDGLPYTITGVSVHYAGGGGGGSNFDNSNPNVGKGGQGGGGQGGTLNDSNGSHGTDGLGGGGGGGNGATSVSGGNGGSGIVILRFPSFGLLQLP